MIELKAHVPSHLLHAGFHVIFEVGFPTKELGNLGGVEHHVGAEHHKFEEYVSAQVHQLGPIAEIWAIDQRSRRPVTHDFDAVDWRSEILVVSLHDSHVPPNEDELSRPFLLVRQYISDPFAHLLLHLVRSFLLLFSRHRPLDSCAGAAITARVRFHQGGGCKNVRVVDAPALNDLANRLVVEGHEAFPEQAILMPEFGLHLHIEPVIDQHQFRFSRRKPSDEYIPGMRITVALSEVSATSRHPRNMFGGPATYAAPEKHLCRE